jgi:hypothetical protein
MPGTFDELQHIDLLLYQRKMDEAANAFFSMLNNLGTHFAQRDQVRDFHHGDPVDENIDICQRAVCQWRLLLQSPIAFSRMDIQPLLGNLHVLHALMMGTCQGNMDDYMSALHLQTGGNYNQETLLRQLFAWCPNSRLGLIPFQYYAHAPNVVLAQAVASLVDLALVSERADQARNAAIDLLISDKPQVGQLSRNKGFNLVPTAWMRCSYADHRLKHKVKPFLGQALARIYDFPKSFLMPAESGSVEGKPVLLIPLEGMTRNHAMYRCYANMIASCRKHFYTLGVGLDQMTDAATAALFDHYEVIRQSNYTEGQRTGFEQLQKLITKFAPAMVYFPSVGMHSLIIHLANLRMAPLQVMTLGHPATSMSRQMDAVLLWPALVGEKGCFSESCVTVPPDTNRLCLPERSVQIEPLRKLPEDGVIRIAVPSVAQKLTARFLRCLAKVQQETQRNKDIKVEFVFFSGEKGIFHACVVQNIQREIRCATVFPFLHYSDYIREINRCQIHACTFPFGGSNSLVDSMRQGLLLVALEEEEAHARVDAYYLRKVGLPESLVCHSEDEYAQCLLNLIENPDELQRLRHFLIDEIDVDNLLMEKGKPEQFADLLCHLHEVGKDGLMQEAVSFKETLFIS